MRRDRWVVRARAERHPNQHLASVLGSSTVKARTITTVGHGVATLSEPGRPLLECEDGCLEPSEDGELLLLLEQGRRDGSRRAVTTSKMRRRKTQRSACKIAPRTHPCNRRTTSGTSGGRWQAAGGLRGRGGFDAAAEAQASREPAA